MPINEGEQAPKFELPQKPKDMVNVGDLIGKQRIVLLFFPFAFSPVCTEEMCHFRDTWKHWESLDARIFAISIDSPFVVDRFREDQQIPFQILSDFNKEVSSQYGGLHDDLIGLKGVAKRAAFVIAQDGTIAYKWVTEDPRVQVPFDEVRAALDSVAVAN